MGREERKKRRAGERGRERKSALRHSKFLDPPLHTYILKIGLPPWQ